MMNKIVSLFLASTLLFAACKREKVQETTDPSVGQNMLNESYGNNPKQRFDIYLPAERSTASTPVLFLIHGGGWSAGSKNDFDGSIAGLRAALPTYAFVTVGYRLSANGNNMFPAQELDVKACIEYVFDHQDYYHVSDKFALWGASAGAHLALLYSYKYGQTSHTPRAIVEFAGPTELISMYNEAPDELIRVLLTGVAGDINTVDSLVYKSSSPVEYITAQSPPTLIIHGDADEVVHVSQAYYLRDKLEALGVEHVFKIYSGEGHGMSSEASVDAVLESFTFINSHMAD